MTHYKLTYFNVKARAEIIRLLFAAAGQEYEDFRFEREDWPKYKPIAPFGQSPYLEVTEGGKTIVLAQSVAIARYLARKYGFYGSNELEKAEIDMYADQLLDMVNEYVDILHDQDEARKKEREAKFYVDSAPKYFKQIDDKLAKSSSGYLVGDSLSWLDLFVISVTEWFREKKDETMAPFPKLKAHDEKIRTLPKIAEWIAKRPVTEL